MKICIKNMYKKAMGIVNKNMYCRDKYDLLKTLKDEAYKEIGTKRIKGWAKGGPNEDGLYWCCIRGELELIRVKHYSDNSYVVYYNDSGDYVDEKILYYKKIITPIVPKVFKDYQDIERTWEGVDIAYVDKYDCCIESEGVWLATQEILQGV